MRCKYRRHQKMGKYERWNERLHDSGPETVTLAQSAEEGEIMRKSGRGSHRQAQERYRYPSVHTFDMTSC